MISTTLGEIAKYVSIGLSSTELNAIATVIINRVKFATRTNIDENIFDFAKGINFPAELWSSQVKAIEGGLLNTEFDSWGFAAPTGTGKSFLTRLLIVKSLHDTPNSKILYIVPSRALVYEVTNNLNSALEDTDYLAGAISPQLVEMDEEEKGKIEELSIVVLTPEKADLLIRLKTEFLQYVSVIIVDEAHHIEAGTRGVLLEMYLWRVKIILKKARVIFLSAVAPNIDQLANWMGKNPASVIDNQRSTRMRAGVYRIKGEGRKSKGWIEYSDGTKVCFIHDKVEKTIRKGIVQLAEQFASVGPVLIVAKGKRESEILAETMQSWLEQQGRLPKLDLNKKTLGIFERLDSRLEREMYTSVSMRKLINNRIAYHHAGLPPRVRLAVEEAIRNNLVDFVFATTTLDKDAD